MKINPELSPNTPTDYDLMYAFWLQLTGLLQRFFKRIFAFNYNLNISDGHKNVTKLAMMVTKMFLFFF